MATRTHTRTHTPSLSHTWPTSQIRAPFILQYIELLCDSPRQRAAILLKAIVNHLWQRERAKDEDLHIHTSLVRTVGRLEFLCTTWQWWIKFFTLSVLPPYLWRMKPMHFQSSKYTSFFLSVGPVPLCLCTFFVRHIHKHTQFPRDTSFPAVLKSLFYLISSNRQTYRSGAGWRASYKKNSAWLNGGMNVVATVQREYDSFWPSTAMINSVLYTFIHQEFVMNIML